MCGTEKGCVGLGRGVWDREGVSEMGMRMGYLGWGLGNGCVGLERCVQDWEGVSVMGKGKGGMGW